MRADRVARVQAALQAEGLGALALMPGPNMRYFLGLEYHVSERPALVFIPAQGDPFAWCPAFEASRLREAGVHRVYPWDDAGDPLAALVQALGDAALAGPLGVEFRQMRVLELDLLQRVWPGLRYRDATGVIAALRAVKDPNEVALLAQAAAVCDAAMAAAHRVIRPGVREDQVHASIAEELQKLGFRGEWHALVASGPRSALPHAATSDRVLEPGDLCWVDFWCHHEGYVGDITRTFPVGRLSGQAAAIYAVVLAAQERARAAARPGMAACDLDAVARDFIAAQGYGPYFTHRTGHGLGLEVHEEPYIAPGNPRLLEPGNVFTIEPGIYIPGAGGVRIEDDVVLVEGGARVLTQYPRDLRE